MKGTFVIILVIHIDVLFLITLMKSVLFDKFLRVKVIFSIKFDGFYSLCCMARLEIFVKSLANRTILLFGNSSYILIQAFLRTSFPHILWNRSIPINGLTSVAVFVEGPEDARHRLLLAFNNDVALMRTLVTTSINHYSLRTLLSLFFRFLHHDLGHTFSLVGDFKLH